MPRVAIIVLSVLLALGAWPASGAARAKKGIWGPVQVNGKSQFPLYKSLGAEVYNEEIRWNEIARSRPANPRDPRDPAYRWRADLGKGIAEAGRLRIQVALRVGGAPRWANRGRPSNWAPQDPGDYVDFMVAAARRYPSVRFWIVWGEPTRASSFAPMPATDPGLPLPTEAQRAVQFYARLLDGSYGALKAISKRKTIVGGNSYTGGNVSPLNWIRYLRLPNGRRPRMDLYGHNAFSARRPRLADYSLVYGYADFSDLDALARWLDRYYGRDPRGNRMRIWIGEWFVPTDHANHVFTFWVTRRVQALWLRAALRISRRWRRIYAFNWFKLYDEAARPAGDEAAWGLIDGQGRRRPAFRVFDRG